MKKIYAFLLLFLITIVLSSCNNSISNSNTNSLSNIPSSLGSNIPSDISSSISGISDSKEDYYINEKVEFSECKELADRIDEIDSINDVMNIEFNDEKINLTSTSLRKKKDDSWEDITDEMFRVTNRNLGPDAIEELVYGLRDAKDCEKQCFDNHIFILNKWEYWENNDGQVRIIFDKNKNNFTWEKLAIDWSGYDGNGGGTPRQEHVMAYYKYNTNINSKNELEIQNLKIRYIAGTYEVVELCEFNYVEKEYFRYRSINKYENYLVDVGRGPYPVRIFYVDTYASLKENDKYVERLRYDCRYDDNDQVVSTWVSYNAINYYKDYILLNEWVNDDDWIFGFSRMYDYSCEEIVTFEQTNNIMRNVRLNLGCIKNIKLFKDRLDGSLYLYNIDDENVDFSEDGCDLDYHSDDGNQVCYIMFTGLDGEAMDEWLIKKCLFNTGTKMMKKMCDTYQSFMQDINVEQFRLRYENREVYSEEYIAESMKDVDLPLYRSSNDVECEIEGHVVFEDFILDLSDFTITVDKGIVFQDGEEYNFDILLWCGYHNFNRIINTHNYKCVDGKIVIDDLETYDLSDLRFLLEFNRTGLTLESERRDAGARAKLCDIILEVRDGKIYGKPVPVDYSIVDVK